MSGFWENWKDEPKHLRADVETQSSAISTSRTVTSTWHQNLACLAFFCMAQCFSSAKSLSAITAREILCRFRAEKIMEYVSLVSKSGIGHLSTMEGWHFPVTARLAACIFLPRKLRVALRVQLCKRGVLSASLLLQRMDWMSYQRIDEAPQGRRWWDLNPCTDKDLHFEPNLRSG